MPNIAAAQKRCAAYPTARPPEDTPCSSCGRCGAAYLDYPAGRDAHIVVFGHPPEATPWAAL
jgi:hypothetical protein